MKEFARLFSATVVPHAAQRYPTTGDWMTRDLCIDVKVSDMGNRDFEFLIAIHETIEGKLCLEAGITDEHVSRFDTLYEAARPTDDRGIMRAAAPVNALLAEFDCGCRITEISEPGDDEHAPYYKQHQLATAVERMLAAELGVSWQRYEQANLDLYEDGVTTT